jgi:SAM-dependent methyltransferase
MSLKLTIGPRNEAIAGLNSGQLLSSIARSIRRLFPFKDFPDTSRGDQRIARTLMRYLPSGSSILDFGSGTCSRSAFMALCGYRVWACDDLGDHWHYQNGTRKKIFEFAAQMGIDFFHIEQGREFPYQAGQFDLVMMINILEHLHDSPYELLCQVLEWIKPGGLLLVLVPNAANLRKRAGMLAGLTNYPPFAGFFWYPAPWRGHVREYVLRDLKLLSRFMQLEVVELCDIHMWVDFRLKSVVTRNVYLAMTSLIPFRGVRDTLLLLARKPQGWSRQHVEDQRPVLSFMSPV